MDLCEQNWNGHQTAQRRTIFYIMHYYNHWNWLDRLWFLQVNNTQFSPTKPIPEVHHLGSPTEPCGTMKYD
jgi:hypothetical protein